MQTPAASSAPLTRSSPLVLLGVSCLSAAVLIVELALTRIFSVTMFYHFAFLAVSVALFGLSASGVFVYITPGWHPPDRAIPLLRRYALLFSIVTVLSTVMLLQIRVELQYSPGNLARLIAIYSIAAVPFFAAGLGLAVAVSRLHADINRVYAADLAGAAGGCLLLIPALNILGGPGALLVAAAVGAAASWLFALAGDPAARRLTALAAAAASVLLLIQVQFRPLDVRDTKGHENDKVLYSKWNSFSRVAVYERPHGDWSLSETYTGPRPESLYMDIDSSASTAILSPSKDRSPIEYLRYELTALAYRLKPSGQALIIGPGGGRDLWTARVFGFSRIDGVEVNPIIVRDVMEGAFRLYSGDVYHMPGVSVVADDGRSFVRRSPDRYDLIQASLVDTWAATTAGAFTMTENHLYTVEAFVDYLSHLKPGGVLTFSRWYDDGLRLVSLAWAAAERLGWPRLSDRLFVARQDRLATFVLKNEPFTDAEIALLVDTTRQMKFVPIYAPASESNPTPAPRNEYTRLATSDDPEAFYRSFAWDISPTTDDRPFFFYSPPQRRPLELELSAAMLFKGGIEAVVTLIAISAAFLLLFIIIPLLRLAPERIGRSGMKAYAPLAYFACLGAGFMLIEMGLMQRFVLFLGQPVYSLTVILFTLLLGGGIGSALSRRIRTPAGALAYAIPGIVASAVVYAYGLPTLFTWWIGLERWMRVLLSVALLLPLGVLLGMPLPAGVRLIGGQRPGLLAWAWAINGATSVVGASVAIYIAMKWGFTRVAETGSVVYALAGLAGLWMVFAVRKSATTT